MESSSATASKDDPLHGSDCLTSAPRAPTLTHGALSGTTTTPLYNRVRSTNGAPTPHAEASPMPNALSHVMGGDQMTTSSGSTSPEILVVLPTLGDRLDFLAETLESVAAQRRTVPLSLVVVSPPTAEAARELALSYGATLIDDPRSGISAAINCGLRARTNERYYAWIGDDDLFLEDGLSLLKRMLDSTPEAVVAYGGCDYIDPDGRLLWRSAAGRLAQVLLPWGPDLIPNPSAMIRLDALEEIGGFDEDLRFAMDLDAFLSLRKLGPFLSTRTSVSAFRWHPDSLTVSDRSGSSKESEAVKRRHLPRALRPLSPLWDSPIRWASRRAAARITGRAQAASGG